MHCLLTGYSKNFNDRHKRVGHLFQNRYKSPIVGETGYFRAAVSYIHLNPLRSGIVPSVEALGEYSWTGHRRILHGGLPEWQDTELLQAEFKDPLTSDGWIRKYCQYIEISENATENKLAGEGTGESLGPDGIRSSESTGPYEVFTALLQRIPPLYGITAAQILSGERNYVAVKVRREILIKCKTLTGTPVAEMARWIGVKESAARYLMNS
jgi:hypothetical protein